MRSNYSTYLGIDVGGTFTDLVTADGAGHVVVAKVPSAPSSPDLAIAQGISSLAGQLNLSASELVNRCALVVHGTTVATNALLERRGVQTALLTTAGFRDLLEMREGHKARNRYDLLSPPPVPLVPRHLRLGVVERMRHSGMVEIPLKSDSLAQALNRLAEEAVEAVAVCFLHSTANPEHEQVAGQVLAERFPALYVCLSHHVLSKVGEYDRLSTTVVNAYVGPILADYLRGLTRSLQALGYHRDILVAQSHGGVLPVAVSSNLAAGAIMSGPAASVYGAAFYGNLLGIPDVISLDMGGTSTDLALVEQGKPALVTQQEVDEVRIALPSLAVHTLGAGGGSIASVGPDGLLQVGPHSAGAEPGPACYGRGGTQPTVTDANLLLGYLNPSNFLGGAIRLDRDAAEGAMTKHVAQPLNEDMVVTAYGVHLLVNAQMAEGIRVVTIQAGHDPRHCALVAGGGAAGLHAVALARELGIQRVIVPKLAPFLSTLGLLATDTRYELAQACVGELDALSVAELRHIIDSLSEEGQYHLDAAGIPESARTLDFSADMLYANQVESLNVRLDMEDFRSDNWSARLRTRFDAHYRTHYGYHQPVQPVHMRTIRLSAIGRLPQPQLEQGRIERTRPAQPVGTRLIYLDEWVQAPLYRLEALSPGEMLSGPAIVEGTYTTILLPEKCEATVDLWGGLTIHVA
jgi:N-methylhydantoinase A